MKNPRSWVLTFFVGAAVSLPAATTLQTAFVDAFKIGVATNAQIDAGQDLDTQHIVIEQFNTITAENELKAGSLCPEPGVYDFAAADQFVAFGESHDMFLVGHTLVWHNQTPGWFFTGETGAPNSPAQQLEVMRTHIAKVAGRYAGRLHAWDVVNEVIADDGSYRPTTWVEGVGGGDELVKHAFKYAEKYAPDTELYYNDFNAWRPEKRDGIVRMVKMLQREGIRIDGVGIQGHWGLNFPQNEYITAAIDAFAALGIKVMITELDLDVLPLTKEGQIIGQGMMHPQFQLEEFKTFLDPYADGLPPAVEAQFTARYVELFRLFYDRRDKIDRVTLWGVNDNNSWKNGYPIPNRTNYPLLWDRAKQPKPVVQELIRIPAKD
ncbi:MAG: endo-1,4-beta-xylanase [Synoicihabitans sp.]